VKRQKATWFETAGAYSAKLFCMHKASFLEQLQVLSHGGEAYLQRACQAGD